MKYQITSTNTPAAALPEAIAPLNPQSLDAWAQAAERALLQEGESPHTLRSYRTALRYWGAWYALRYQQPLALPLQETVLVQFVVDHAQRLTPDQGLVCEMPPAVDQALVQGRFKTALGPPALNTLLHRVSVMSKLHSLAQHANPCQQPRVRELIAKTRQAHARRGALPVKKPALTREPLEALLATCDDSLIGLRDRALLLFAWSSGGRRRSEVTMATLENTRREGNAFVFTLQRSKTNPQGTDRAENDKPVVGRAAQALRAWITATGLQSGAIFRRVRRGGLVAEPLTPAAVRDIVKKRCELAGLSLDYSAHSLRSGFVTEAGRRQVPLGETMALTGHRSVASLLGYFRQDVTSSQAARLLDALDEEEGDTRAS